MVAHKGVSFRQTSTAVFAVKGHPEEESVLGISCRIWGEKTPSHVGITMNHSSYESSELLRRLQEEQSCATSGGIYHEIQVRMAYNSNRIEGSRLSEDQTRMIYETRTIAAEDGVSLDDVLETVHHFKAFDYCITHANSQVSEELIKHLHYILKHDTKDEDKEWFAVGDYKRVPNMVGGRETSSPDEVPRKIKKLIEGYNRKSQNSMEDIIGFHAEFELIHPFQDGNGRVGRLLAFQQCLAAGIVPFIIEDSKKYFYYRGLSRWTQEKGWLIDTCLDGQDTMVKLLEYFRIEVS